MQASTASICLRKLSDCVYSQSKPQADSRFIMLFTFLIWIFSDNFGFYTMFVRSSRLTNLKFCLRLCLVVQGLTRFVRAFGVSPLWHSENQNGYNTSTGRLPGSSPL